MCPASYPFVAGCHAMIRTMADPEGAFTAYIEIPKGSRNKYEYDHETGALKLDRMVCVSEPTFPGCMIDVKPIALFKMEDDKGIDDKVLAVPLSDPSWNQLESLDDLPKPLQNEIAHFFSVYK